MNKNLIIAILIIVIVGIAAFMVFSHPGTTGNKVNTQMNMLSAASLQNGDQIEFQLKDDKGNLLSGQMVELQFSDGAGNNETFKVITDTNGKGYLVLEDESAGSHDFTATYAGNGNYSGDALASAEQLGILSRHIDETLREMAKELRAGSVAADPWYRSQTETACSFCDYAGACHFDAEDDCIRYVSRLKPQQVWELMQSRKEAGE